MSSSLLLYHLRPRRPVERPFFHVRAEVVLTATFR